MLKPSALWVDIDEDPGTLDDATFLVDMGSASPAGLLEMPTRVHGNAYCWNFADAHSEVHKLKDKITINWGPESPAPGGTGPYLTPSRGDASWTVSLPNEPATYNPDWADISNYTSIPEAAPAPTHTR